MTTFATSMLWLLGLSAYAGFAVIVGRLLRASSAPASGSLTILTRPHAATSGSEHSAAARHGTAA